MKLTSVHVTNFRCIEDSTPVEIGTSTCLVGKNESGKTAFLKALEGLMSVDEGYTEYNKTENYPRRYLADYKERHKHKEAQVISTVWQLDQYNKDALANELGEDAIKFDEVTISKSYEKSEESWSVPIDEGAVIHKLINQFGLSVEDRAPIENVTRMDECAQILEGLQNRTDPQSNLLSEIDKYPERSAESCAARILKSRMPQFMYFSHYDRMSGEISINQLNADRQQNQIHEGDQLFLDFLEYAGTSLKEITSATRFEDLNAKCEAAANRITDQVFEYWTQNDQLNIEVHIDEGKSEDKPPFDSGTVVRARVKNNLHRATVPFSERSAGFVWFFSFLVKFAQVRKYHGEIIILLDEPGLTLHGTAQKDLLRYFTERLEPQHQVIYTTHSPFMVPVDKLSTVRTVEDVVRRDSRNRPQSDGTKICADFLTTDPQTTFPLLGAMGYEITQSLIIAPNTLLVEGPSDILYLEAVSNRLKSLDRTCLDPKWAICPSGGIDKVLTFVKLFYGNKLNIVVLTDFAREQKNKLKLLYNSELLQSERIILATQIADKDEADTEDFFTEEFFSTLLNEAYGLEEEQKLTAKKLIKADNRTVRNVKRAEAYFRLLPDKYPVFSHYDPALYLLTHPELLEENSTAVNQSLDRFEAVFELISQYA